MSNIKLIQTCNIRRMQHQDDATTGTELFFGLGRNGGLFGGTGSDCCLTIFFDDLHTDDFSMHSLWQR